MRDLIEALRYTAQEARRAWRRYWANVEADEAFFRLALARYEMEHSE